MDTLAKVLEQLAANGIAFTAIVCSSAVILSLLYVAWKLLPFLLQRRDESILTHVKALSEMERQRAETLQNLSQQLANLSGYLQAQSEANREILRVLNQLDRAISGATAPRGSTVTPETAAQTFPRK